MATEPTSAGDVPADVSVSSDHYQNMPKPSQRVSADARFPASCMMVTTLAGLLLLVSIILCWGIGNISTLDFGLLFR